MFKTERQLEDYIWEDLSRLNKHFRPIARQLKVPNGILDILAYTEIGDLWVIELKKDAITKDALIQVNRYAVDIYEIAFSIVYGMGLYQKFGMPTVRRMVVGSELSEKVAAISSYLDVYSVTYTADETPKFHIMSTPSGPNPTIEQVALRPEFDSYRSLLKNITTKRGL